MWQNVYVDIVNWTDTTNSGSVNAPFPPIPYAISNTTWTTVLNIIPSWDYTADVTLRDDVFLYWPTATQTWKVTCNWLNFFQWMRFTRASTTTETFIDCVTNACTALFDYCSLTLTTATDNIQPTIIDATNAATSLTITNSDNTYTNTSTAANSSTTSLYKLAWAWSFTLANNNFFPTISQASWDVITIDEASTVLATTFWTTHINISNNAWYSWEMAVHRVTAAWIDKRSTRSEERRVGKECRYRWSPYH